MRAIGSGVRMPATTSSPCAFSRNSPKSTRSPVAGSRVKQTPVPERCAAVAEDHLHDVHRRPEIVGDLVRPPVHLGAGRVPRLEDRPVRAAELLAGVLRERAARPLLVDRLERLDELAQVVRGEVDVLRDAPRSALRSASACSKRWPSTPSTTSPYIWMSRRYESSAKRGVPGGRGQALDRDLVEPEVEDGVHHPGHRDRGARADGDEERVARVAEALARALLERGDVLGRPRRRGRPGRSRPRPCRRGRRRS